MPTREYSASLLAIGVYFVFGLLLIGQKPGLQYDEAQLIAGAVHMEHSATISNMDVTPDVWVCPLGHCIPLMSYSYVGSAKELVSLPFFAIFGPRTPVIRLVALMLGAFAIWGIYVLVEPWFGRTAAIVSALALAINPALLNMVIFDNGGNAAFVAAFGLTCGFISIYATRKTTVAAFGLGAAMGFGVWSRANFIWLMIAGVAAALIIFRRRVLIPGSHIAAIVLGGILGGLPFLVFQIVSGGATWKVQGAVTASQSMTLLLRERVFLFADTILSDGEHREMWNGPSLPVWQMWLFPIVVLLACAACLFLSGREEAQRRSFARFLVLTFLITGGFLFFSRLQVAEHHIVILVPLAIAIVVMACAVIQTRFHQARVLSVALLLIYGASAIYWQIESVRGLKNSGGIGVWSNAGIELAGYLDQGFRKRDIKLLDWGLRYNVYVLTDGRIQPREIYSMQSEDISAEGRPWADVIRVGGVFVLNGPENRQFPKPSTAFLRALALARPIVHRHNVAEHSGSTYAEVFEIVPDSIRGPLTPGASPDARISMEDPLVSAQLTGFYPPEAGKFRWTKREFSATLTPPGSDADTGTELSMRLYIPEVVIRKLGSVTLHAKFGGHALVPETWSRAGQYVLRRQLNNEWLDGKPTEIDFSLDKAMPPSPSDARELGIAVMEISVEPE